MPFDLPRSLAKLRQRHADPLGLRFALLDLLFAVGCGVREQAIALPWGDALCLRTAGPPAPGDGPRLVLLALDLELPGPDGAEPSGRWPADRSHLGGPAATLAWATALHALVGSGRQQPWELVLVRSPAMGAAEFLSALCVDLAATHLALLQPVSAGHVADLDLVRVDLQRPRNIWRFPTCDHTVTLQGRASFGGALPAIREVIAGLGPGAAWTLHDLKVAASDAGAFSAVLRASVPPRSTAAVQVTPTTGDLRLLFPVNDALSALHGLAERMPAAWQAALGAPIAAHTAPDGLTVHALGPQIGTEVELAERTAQMTAAWSVEPLCRRWSGSAKGLAVAANADRPAVPAGLPAHAQVWYVPDFADDNDGASLRRALVAAFGA